jgi:hypothetical protein
MTARVVPFEMYHLNSFIAKNPMPGLEEICEFNLKNPSFRQLASVFAENVCIALCGTHRINKDCVEVFLIPSIYIKNHAKSIVWAMRTLTEILLKEVDRIQMPVLAENRKWAETLGFTFEGIASKYIDGQDHYMFVKVRA